MKRVFLSFAHEDIEKVKSLMPLLANPNYDLDFYGESLDIDINGEGADCIKRAMGEKLSKCSVTVCFVGENTYKSTWVDCQLKKSRYKGNKIIAMALKGIESVVLPNVIREENLTFYPWNPQKLAELIGETPRRFPIL